MKKEVRLIVDVAGSREAVAMFEQYVLQWHVWQEKRNGRSACPTVSAEVAERTVMTESVGSDLMLRVYQPFEYEETPT